VASCTPSIHVKPGVVFKEFNHFFFEFINALRDCAKRFDCNYTITSANDGKHRADSYHYKNTAWDVRLRDISPGHWYVLQAALITHLPPYFDILIEGVGTENLHLHVEADLSKVADFILSANDVRDHAEGGQ
jgi:hypothetical protein